MHHNWGGVSSILKVKLQSGYLVHKLLLLNQQAHMLECTRLYSICLVHGYMLYIRCLNYLLFGFKGYVEHTWKRVNTYK